MFSGNEFHNLGAATIEDDRQESWIIWQKGTKLNTRWVRSGALIVIALSSHDNSVLLDRI